MTDAARWVDAAVARLQRELSLSAVAVPPRFAAAGGTYRAQPATLISVAFEGPGFGRVRAVSILGEGLEIHNVLALPRATLAAPLLGIDLVDLGKPELIVVGDASPPPGDQTVPLPAPSLAAPGPLPGWCERFFSPAPLFARVPRAQFAAAAAELDLRVAALCSPAAPHPEPEAHRRWQQAYLDAHRTEDRGLLLLGKIFGEEWARDFLEGFLFPVRYAGG